jgi:SAM-dependent methyltransferase
MPYRARFDCLWCGDAWTARGPGDLEGWAQLCPTCLGRAGTNTFLRSRLRAALAARSAAGEGGGGVDSDPNGSTSRATAAPSRPKPPAPTARSDPAFPDDWFLRRGPFERGPVHDTAWAAELDAVILWLDAQPLGGRILEPAAGVGFFSPLLAERGELHASDADAAALDVARQRLLAHHLLAHLHPADPWTPPAPADQPFDALVAAFLLGRVRGAGLDRAAATLHARLRAGGALALVDLRPDPSGGPPEGIRWSYHDPEVVEAALARADFAAIIVRSTGRFFTTVSATAG